MTCLVTGAGGFIGSWLVEHLRDEGATVAAFGHAELDVLDPAAIHRVLGDVRPVTIYHLAAQSLPGVSWANPAATFRVNVEGTLNLMDAVRVTCPGATVVVACSSSEYAWSERPIREEDPMDPRSPYAASKLAVDHLARLYCARYAMKIVVARPFFLIGPRKTGDVSSDLARRMVAIERGQQAELIVGRLDVVRDFLDIRDGVAALALLGERGRAGEAYNISSGRPTRIAELVEIFKRHLRVTAREYVDPSLVRPLDEPVKVGDNSKLRTLGWAPRHTLAETVLAILEYWRCKS